jgi:hypothetical protein
MAEVELILKADNSQYVSKVREAQKATQDLHNSAAKGQQREKGLIQDIEDELTKLQQKQKEAFTTKDIEKYNQKIAEAKKDLKEYNELGLKTEKTTDSLSKSITKWALSIGGAAMILKKLGDAFKETIVGMNLFNQVGTITKTILNDIVTGAGFSIQRIMDVVKAQKILNDLRVEEYFDQVKISKLNNEYQKQYTEAINQNSTKIEQLQAIDKALKAHNDAIDIEVEHTKKAIEAYRKLTLDNKGNEAYLKQYMALLAKLEDLDAQRDASTKRLNSRRSGIEKSFFDDIFTATKGMSEAVTKWEEDYDAERLKRQQEYQQASLKLLDDHEKSVIDSLTGDKKLEAERKYAIKQIKEFMAQLAKLGTVTGEQKQMLQVMVDNVWGNYFEELADGAKTKKPTAEQQKAISKALLGNMPTLEGIQKSYINTTPGSEPQEFSFWNLLGLNPDEEEDQKMIDALQKSADKVQEIFIDILDQRVEFAQRERELLDTRISETQRELELEAGLMQEGYANNLTARKAYLEQLKVERDKALAEEEKAIRQQQAVAKLLQTMNLLSSVSEILKSATKKGLVGLALAPFAIATLWAIWAKAKSSTTMLAEGGSGTVTGRRHSEGGERFLDHVEIEQGERWGVLSRRASGKYGDMFSDMVSSFNKDQMPQFITPTTTNMVRVDNNGPNSRLDRVIKEQEKMNTQLRQGQLYTVGNKRIIKSGNKTRIIG